jgi:hypothetical protein
MTDPYGRILCLENVAVGKKQIMQKIQLLNMKGNAYVCMYNKCDELT